MIPTDLIGYGLKEINLYPYLTLIFYGALLFLSPFWMRTEKRLFTLFLVTLIFETAFLIDVGFFIRPSYVIGLILILHTLIQGVQFPARYAVLLILFVLVSIMGVLMYPDLIGQAELVRGLHAIFLRPVIQLGQFATMFFVAIAVFTLLKRRQYFQHTVRVLHWLSVAVALSAMYEIAAIYFNLPYLNLNNMDPEYWYPRFGVSGFTVFRARVTFIEPIELNNFQMLGIASSLVYRLWHQVPWRRYWPLLAIQLLVLLGTFSRSTLLTLLVLVPIFFFLYPQPVRSVFGFVMSHGRRWALMIIMIGVAVYGFTLTPQKLAQSNFVIKTLFTRAVLHKAKFDQLTFLGRGGAVEEITALHQDGKLALGVGIGNEANFWGGGGGSNSLYNQIITYGGIVGLTIFLMFIGLILFSLFHNYLRWTGDVLFRKINFIFFISFLGMLTQRLSFSGLLTDTYLWVTFALYIYLGQIKRSEELAVHSRKI